jgi:hypothetical protein
MTTVPVAPIEMEQAPAPGAAAHSGLVRGLAVTIAVVLAASVVGLATISPKKGPSGDVLAAVLGAAAKTTSADSARMSFKTRISVSSGGSLPSISIDGVQQFTGDRLGDFTVHAAGVTLHMLNAGTTSYIEVPARVRQSGGIPTLWASVDNSSNSAGNPLSSVMGPSVPGGGDALTTLQELRANGVVKQATEGGRQSVRGVSTRVYHLVLDAAQYKEAIRQRMKDNPAAAAAAIDQLEVADPTLDLYVDGAGLVRRQVLDIDSSFSGQGQSAHISAAVTVDLFDFGTPVVVHPPPAAQVTPLSSPAQMAQLFGGSG